MTVYSSPVGFSLPGKATLRLTVILLGCAIATAIAIVAGSAVMLTLAPFLVFLIDILADVFGVRGLISVSPSFQKLKNWMTYDIRASAWYAVGFGILAATVLTIVFVPQFFARAQGVDPAPGPAVGLPPVTVTQTVSPIEPATATPAPLATASPTVTVTPSPTVTVTSTPDPVWIAARIMADGWVTTHPECRVLVEEGATTTVPSPAAWDGTLPMYRLVGKTYAVVCSDEFPLLLPGADPIGDGVDTVWRAVRVTPRGVITAPVCRIKVGDVEVAPDDWGDYNNDPMYQLTGSYIVSCGFDPLLPPP